MVQCEMCGEGFSIEPEDLEFYAKVSPIVLGRSFPVPPPRSCPTCRMRRRLVWRNEYRYYRRSCDLCGKSVISIFHSDHPFPVYCHGCWWSDRWDAAAYGRDFDFSRTFAEQFVELYRAVPQKAMIIESSCENCEYCQDIGYAKDCYLVTGSWKLRDCYYSSNCNRSTDLVDCDSVNIDCELVYESTDSQRLYRCSNLQLSSGCRDCHYGIDLRGCSNCIGCYGLRQQQFRIFNVQYTEAEFRARVSEMNFGSRRFHAQFEREFSDFCAPFPRKAAHLVNCEESRGDKLFNCRNVHGFDTIDAEHCRWFYKGDSPKNCYDVHQSGNPQWCYESVTPDDSYMALFTTWCFKSNRFVAYSDSCHLCENVFGSVGLRQQKNTIFNKQYSNEEYGRLLGRILAHMSATGEWGEFFPERGSPFGYNETLAFEYFPLTKSEAMQRGYSWRDDEPREGTTKQSIMPDNIFETKDAVVSETFSCEGCTKHYRVTTRELAFYRKMALPPPNRCVECRRRKRLQRRTPYRLWKRSCDSCGSEIESSYAPGGPEIVFCSECYERTLY